MARTRARVRARLWLGLGLELLVYLARSMLITRARAKNIYNQQRIFINVGINSDG